MTRTQTHRARPTSTPAYYLGRPAGWWIAALSADRRPAREVGRRHETSAIKEPQ